MNKNTIIGLVLIFAIMIGYTWWSAPSEEELAARQHTRDSIIAAQAIEQQQQLERQAQMPVQADTLPAEAITPAATAVRDSSAAVNRFGVFAGSTTGTEQDFILETDLLRLTISSKGGRISQVELKDYKTFDGKPLLLFVPDSSMFDIGFYADNRVINTSHFYFKPEWSDVRFTGKDNLQITGNDSLSFAMRLYAGASDSITHTDKYIEFIYSVRNDRYMVGFDVNFVNMDQVLPVNTKDLNVNWYARLLRQEKSLSTEKMNTSIHYRHSDGEVDYLSERKDDAKKIQTRVKWISFKQQFFASTLIADEYFINTDLEKTGEPEKEPRYLETMTANLSLPFNPAMDKQVGMHFYFGPLKYNILRKYKLDFERQIPLGWSFFLMQWINRFAVLPVFNFLEGFNLNYGIIILILTVLLKIVLFPIAYKTYMSSAKMRVLKPEIDEINAKFPKKEDAMKKQQAVMTLYKKAGANPMSGCIPMLLQFPILLAMFRFFPASIELRQESFLWATDLSSYDSILDLPFNIPFYGDHVSLFTLLMTISTIIYTKMNNDMMSTGNQMPGMKMMMYMMPIMFLGFFNSYSSGLSYYYLLANLMTFAQMFLIRSFVDEDKLHAQIQENKKKPVKKSNFQKRLEDMAKNQGKK
ncbi:MAG: membrane protein insertase YidC [Lentimicrobium sp.]|jgi:YidC/Oxa1 family membrane protein insertase|nr:membrane protein insertase YidC [Lentimicrobium sp.]